MSEQAGWEVEGFIDRLTRRDDTNSERLVLESVSHLRAFSRDCDALRDDNRELRAEVERLLALIQSAYAEGFSEGMNEHTKFSGGRPWKDSRAKRALEGK
jgi:hypothetical protein